jgi:hypothetical protein
VTASIGPTEKPPFVLAAWREKLAALGAEDFLNEFKRQPVINGSPQCLLALK